MFICAFVFVGVVLNKKNNEILYTLFMCGLGNQGGGQEEEKTFFVLGYS